MLASGHYKIPSRQWDSDSDALESDFEDDTDAPNYFGENLGALYENIENRKLASPMPRTVSFICFSHGTAWSICVEIFALDLHTV